MLRKFGRRFYSAKYVYSIHLHGVTPWFMHERPARISWKRGSKKHKKGTTKPRMPVRMPGAHINNGTLEVDETFELGATLYAESNKTKKTGPYGTKELKLVIMEVDDDGSVYSILGALTINLNEYVGLMDHKLRVPIECDSEIIEAVGQPYFDITVRSWYKQGTGGTSVSSGISSTGWTAAGSDSEEEHTEILTTGDSHEDPVKLVDAVSPSPNRTSSTYAMDSVPENIEVEEVEEVGNQEQDVVTDKEEPVQQMTPMTAIPDKMIANAVTFDENARTEASLTTIDTEKNNVHDDVDEEEIMESPPAVTVAEQRSHDGRSANLDPSSLILHRRFDRLSTITSEAGEEAMAIEENEDELNKFLKAEMGDEEVGLEGLPVAVSSPASDSIAPITEEEHQQQFPIESIMKNQVTRDVEEERKKEQDAEPESKPEINSAQETIANKVDLSESTTLPPSSLPAEGEKKEEPAAITLHDDAVHISPSEKEALDEVSAVVQPPTKVSLEDVSEGTASAEAKEVAAVKEVEEVTPARSKEVSSKEIKEVGAKESSRVASPSKTRPARYSSPRRHPPSRGFWSCLPGSGLVCCQPALPREP